MLRTEVQARLVARPPRKPGCAVTLIAGIEIVRARKVGPAHLEQMGPTLPPHLATALAFDCMPDLNREGKPAPRVVKRVTRTRARINPT